MALVFNLCYVLKTWWRHVFAVAVGVLSLQQAGLSILVQKEGGRWQIGCPFRPVGK